jgi:hypothetical protein
MSSGNCTLDDERNVDVMMGIFAFTWVYKRALGGMNDAGIFHDIENAFE